MKGKNTWEILSVIFTLCIVFQGIFYYSYTNSQKEKSMVPETEQQEQAVVPIDHMAEDILKPGAKYTCIVYNKVKDTSVLEEGKIASAFVGWTRDELETYLVNYMKQVSEEEKEKGLQNIELLNFSEDGITVKKTYDPRTQYKYLLVVEKNEIVVYDADWNTKYENTGINVKNLSEEEREKLNEGIYVKDETELYGILEDYSS